MASVYIAIKILYTGNFMLLNHTTRCSGKMQKKLHDFYFNIFFVSLNFLTYKQSQAGRLPITLL